MAFVPTSPLPGGSQTGWTAPTYTLTADTPPADNPSGKQWMVTALGGTQAGVIAHSVAAPFTLTVMKPKVLRQLGTPNPVTGVVKSVPRNTYQVLVRKGVLPLAGQPYQTMIVRCTIEVPAGADIADPQNVKAAIAAMSGALWDRSAGLGDTSLNGGL